MERTVLEESWRRNGPVGQSLEVIDDDDSRLENGKILNYVAAYILWWSQYHHTTRFMSV
jgi:hypothetical protein